MLADRHARKEKAAARTPASGRGVRISDAQNRAQARRVVGPGARRKSRPRGGPARRACHGGPRELACGQILRSYGHSHRANYADCVAMPMGPDAAGSSASHCRRARVEHRREACFAVGDVTLLLPVPAMQPVDPIDLRLYRRVHADPGSRFETVADRSGSQVRPGQSRWRTTLITLPSGARTKKRRTPQDSVVIGCTIS